MGETTLCSEDGVQKAMGFHTPPDWLLTVYSTNNERETEAKHV